MNSVSDCFQRQQVLGPQVLQLLAQYRQQLEANLARLNDLQKASVSEDQARAIVALFHAQGFVTEPMEDIFHEQNLLAGRLLKATLRTRP